MTKGFLYILSNPSMPGLLKIGFSQQVPELRAAELFTTGVPLPFIVEYYCVVDDADQIELRTHLSLKGVRCRDDREFFRIDVETARKSVEENCTPEVHWVNPRSAPNRQQPETQQPETQQPENRYRTCPKCGTTYQFRDTCSKCQCALVAGGQETQGAAQVTNKSRPFR